MSLGIVLVGSGSIASTHARAIGASAKTHLVGVTGGSGAAALADEHGCRHFFTLEEALTERGVGAIDHCGPSGTRVEATEAAAAAGRHVLVEKPIEVTLERAERMIDACHRGNVTLSVIFQSRFKDVYGAIRTWLTEGRLGRLTLAGAYIRWYRSQAYYDSGGWRGTWQFDGGGALMNQGIHTIDLLRWLMGDVASIYGVADTLTRRIEVEDTAAAVLRFTSGALGVIEATTSSYPGSPRRLEIRGDRGTVVVVDDHLEEADFEGMTDADHELANRFREVADSGSASTHEVADYGWHQRQIEDFADAVLQGRAPLVTGEEGRRTLELVLAIYESSRKGHTVRFPLGSG